MNKKIIENMKKHNKDLSVYACKDESAFRLKKESNDISKNNKLKVVENFER